MAHLSYKLHTPVLLYPSCPVLLLLLQAAQQSHFFQTAVCARCLLSSSSTHCCCAQYCCSNVRTYYTHAFCNRQFSTKRRYFFFRSAGGINGIYVVTFIGPRGVLSPSLSLICARLGKGQTHTAGQSDFFIFFSFQVQSSESISVLLQR